MMVSASESAGCEQRYRGPIEASRPQGVMHIDQETRQSECDITSSKVEARGSGTGAAKPETNLTWVVCMAGLMSGMA